MSERLANGPLLIGDLLRTGREIAEALASAHKAGVVHRDLKAANVMLTRAGAKLLDFGLARLVRSEPSPDSGPLMSGTTAEAPLTSEGALIGTLPYMAPEQVGGGPADVRTDVFALGALLARPRSPRRP